MADGEFNDEINRKRASASEIKTYHFLQRKYGRDLLMDIGRIETLDNFVLDNTPHQISFYEILFIEKGKGDFSLDENRMAIEPGTIIFTSPGQVRRWNIKQAVSGYTVFFEKDFLNLFFTDDLFLFRFHYFHQYSTPTNIKVPSKIFQQTLELVSSMEEEFRQLQNDSNHLLRAILYQLLVILDRHYAATYSVKSDTYVHPIFFRFRSLIEKEFSSHRHVSTYSQLLKISSAQLNKICRQYSGLSAQQMIHHRLVYEIKKQLRCNKSAKEIAYEFDFSDPSNFNRFFKKLTGTTAQQYRDSL
jgi:AraC family transcriptional regulator, transcriptional activator of pobA